MKLKSKVGILLHVSIHLLVTALLIKEPLSFLPLFIMLAATHFLIDWLKLRYPTQRQAPGFLVDQLLHLIALGFLAVTFTAVQPALPTLPLIIALVYAFIPPIIMYLWLLTIDKCQMNKSQQPAVCVKTKRRNLLLLSQQAGLPLIIGVGLWILFL